MLVFLNLREIVQFGLHWLFILLTISQSKVPLFCIPLLIFFKGSLHEQTIWLILKTMLTLSCRIYAPLRVDLIVLACFNNIMTIDNPYRLQFSTQHLIDLRLCEPRFLYRIPTEINFFNRLQFQQFVDDVSGEGECIVAKVEVFEVGYIARPL